MNTLHLIALPGTLLDERSLQTLLRAVSASGEVQTTTLLLGSEAHIDDEVDRLIAWTDEHVSAPALWLGHSLGGIVALQLAQRCPRRVAGLVLLGANARGGRQSSEARRRAQWGLAQQQGLATLAHIKLAPGYGLAAGDAALASLVDQARAVGLQRFENQLAYARQRPGLLEPRRALKVPVLALSAERDSLCPPAHSDEIVSLVEPPHITQHHRLPGAGHLFPMQQPAWAADRVNEFLAHLKECNA